MGKQDVYSCDRCRHEFQLHVGKQPNRITLLEEGQSEDEEEENIVCEDCMSTIHFAMSAARKEVDTAVEEYVKKKYPDE